MARSRQGKERKKTSRLIIAIPLIALALIAAVYVVSVYPSLTPAAMDFTDQIYIEVGSYQNATDFAIVHPNQAIGEPGAIWATHQYDSNGIGSNYPLYMDAPYYACPNPKSACTFHVKSKVVHPYTLGDFMTVWGYPTVSQNDTFGVKSKNGYVWQICVGANPAHATVDTQWGALVLQPQMAITMIYYSTANAFGCAAS